MENTVPYAVPAIIIFIHFCYCFCLLLFLQFLLYISFIFYFLLGEYGGTHTREVHIHGKHGHNVTENVEARNRNMPFLII